MNTHGAALLSGAELETLILAAVAKGIAAAINPDARERVARGAAGVPLDTLRAWEKGGKVRSRTETPAATPAVAQPSGGAAPKPKAPRAEPIQAVRGPDGVVRFEN